MINYTVWKSEELGRQKYITQDEESWFVAYHHLICMYLVDILLQVAMQEVLEYI